MFGGAGKEYSVSAARRPPRSYTMSEKGEPQLSEWSGRMDGELIRQIVAGERGLFELLMRKNNRRLYRVVRGLLQSESEVEETMQQTYVEAFAHLSEFQEDVQFSTWLFRIGINQALTCARRRKPVCEMISAEPGPFVARDDRESVTGEPEPENAPLGYYPEPGLLGHRNMGGGHLPAEYRWTTNPKQDHDDQGCH
jgi:DNA-directed RNA polymerase specialized sigma24 family protein